MHSPYRHVSSALAAAILVCALSTTPARAAGIIDEARFGVYEHDASVLGHQKETGADINLEALFVSPDFLDVIGGPRPIVGALINTSGETDQIYIGLTWTWDFAHDILMDGDGLYLEGTLGGAAHDGKLNVQGQETLHRKSLGSPVLFREDADLGYRLTPRYSIAVSYNHISDADLATRNEGLNDIGVRFGIRF